MEPEAFRSRLAAWTPLDEPTRAWFAASRRLGARDLANRLAQLTDCVWCCLQLANHRGHATRRVFSAQFEALRSASRHLETRGRKGLKRAIKALDEAEHLLVPTLVALPSNMGPMTLPGRSFRCDAVATGAGLRFIGVPESIGRWKGLIGASWLDIGPGDGASFIALAEARPETQFVGVDLGEAVVKLPANARYLSLREGSAESLADQTRKEVSSVSVVSLLYPIHREQDGKLAVAWQVETALDVLQEGGVGVLITEDGIALRAAVEVLLADRRCVGIDVVDRCWSAAQLRSHGITPYAPTWSELTPSPQAVADQIAGSLSWGLVLFFSRG